MSGAAVSVPRLPYDMVDWPDLLKRVELRGLFGAVSLRIDRGAYLTIDLTTTDVRTGELTHVYGTNRVPIIATEVEALAWLRRALVSLMEHEIDEALWVDGQQVNDPHPPLEFAVQIP